MVVPVACLLSWVFLIAVSKVEQKKEKPETLDGEPASYSNTDDLDGESYFFFYFMVVCVLFVLGYVGYHNRQRVCTYKWYWLSGSLHAFSLHCPIILTPANTNMVSQFFTKMSWDKYSI